MNFLKQNKLIILAFIVFSLLAIWSWPKTGKRIALENKPETARETAVPEEDSPKPVVTASSTAFETEKSKQKISTKDEPQEKITKAENRATGTADNLTETAVTESLMPAATSTAIVPKDNQAAQKTLTATIQIGTEKYALTLPENSSAYDALVYLKENQGLSFSAKSFSGIGYFVEEINGIKNDPQKNLYWGYYINGKSATVGASSYILINNDNILWKYDKIDF